MRLSKMPVVVVVVLSALAFVLFQDHNISAQTTTLGSLAASMQPGTWAELTTNNLNSTFSSANAGGGASGIINGYTDDAVWDPISRQVLFIGGDHNWGVAGTAKLAVYSAATNSWQQRPRPSWSTGVMHGYDHSAIDAANGIFYHRPYNTQAVHRYNIASQTWDQPAMPNFPFASDYNNCCDAVEFFPELGGLVWVSGNGNVYLYRTSTNQWSKIAGNLALGGTWHSAEYNPIHKVLVFYSDQTGAFYKLSSSGQVTRLSNPPISLYDNGYVGPLTVDPVSGKYLALTPKSHQFYTFDVLTNAWQHQPSAGRPKFDDFVVATPISTYGVNLFVSCEGGAACRVYIYKHSAGGGGDGAGDIVATASVPSFDFSISNGGDKTVTAGQPVSNSVTAGLISGTTQPVSFSVSGLPSGVTASFNASSCNPDCNSTLNLATSGSTPVGSSSVTVTGTSGSLSHTTSFILTVVGTSSPPSAASPASSSFAQKCGQPGVLNCFGFDSSSTLYYTWPTGTSCDAVFAGQTNYNFGLDRRGPGNTAAVIQNGQCVYPQLDTAIFRSGGSSLRMAIPSNSGADSGGYFSDAFKRTSNGKFEYIGPGSSLGNVLYFQFYQRFDSNFVSTEYQCYDGGCGGWKQAIWYGNPPKGSSSSSIEVTMYNGWQRNVPQMYGQQGHDDYGIEDAVGCTYANATSTGGSGSGFDSRPNYSAPLNPTCAHYVANQWMEFTGRIEIRGPSDSPSSRVQLWVDGRLVIDYGSARINWAGKDGDGFGQFLLSPYHTNKNASIAHPDGFTWYDDLIISTQPIAMGGGTEPEPPPPADTTAPAVSITGPSNGATVSGTTGVSADASDDVQVAGVQFKLDGANLGAEDTTPPYSVSWNTTTASNGSHTLTALARDAAGNQKSAGINVIVNNAATDTTLPTVSITSPAHGAPLSGTITVSANAADNVGVAGVQFKLDGANLGPEDTTSGYSVSWNTATASNGPHTLSAVARDAAGNQKTSTITVVVSNVVSDTTLPTVSITSPASGSHTSGMADVSANASDNVKVIGVQFKLDGQDLGAEDTASPYSTSWDTTTASNGAHILTAVARDAAGNRRTSSAVPVIVNNAPLDPSGLIGYWALEEGAGTRAGDSSGNNYAGTLTKNPSWVAGKVGKALKFNATDNGNDSDDPRVVVGRDFDVSKLPFTVSVWVNPTDFADWRAIFSKRDSYTRAGMRFDLGLHMETGQVYATTSTTHLTFDYTPPKKTWTHITIVASATDTRLYVNGVLRKTMGVLKLGTKASANTVIGGTGEGTSGDNDPFKGMIDELRIYNRALSASEVQGVYSNTKP